MHLRPAIRAAAHAAAAAWLRPGTRLPVLSP